MARRPEVAVLIPLVDGRGDIGGHLRSWTHDQTLARDRYQVVVADNSGDPLAHQRLGDLLAPHDVWVETPASHVSGLWNAAAARADAPWLLFTEGHCIAEPRCLELLTAALTERPDIAVARLQDRHVARSRGGELCVRWFAEVYAAWSVVGQPRLNTVATVIRRQTFDEAGGLDDSLGMFAATMLAARLCQRGLEIASIPEARVTHLNTDTLAEHNAFAADFTRGECAARDLMGTVFSERNFGHDAIWSNRLRYRHEISAPVCWALLDAARRSANPADLSWVLAAVPAWLPAWTGALRIRMVADRARVRTSEFVAERLPLPSSWRWKSFQRAHESTVSLSRRQWIQAQRPPDPVPAREVWTAADLDGATLVAGHGLEQQAGCMFRWSEPVALLRTPPAPGSRCLQIETGGLRGDPAAYFYAAYTGRVRVPAAALRSVGDRIEIRLDRRQIDEAARHGVTLLSRPLRPLRYGSVDRRQLGIPVVAVSWHPGS